MPSASTRRPAGSPSRMVTSAWPCDSPAVRNRSTGWYFTSRFLARSWSGSTIGRRSSRGPRFALGTRVPLIASRFLETREGVLDLATGDLVTLRRLPPCERTDEGAWRDACERLLHLWHEDLPTLIDYGHFGDGRFEAYQRMPRRPLSQQVHAAVSAFLGAREGVNTDISDGEPRFGMNLAIPRALLAVAHVLEDARPGEALSIECVPEPAAGATTFLRLAAVAGRRRGFVPVRAAVLGDRPQLRRRLEGRSVLLLSDRPESARAAQKWFFRLGVGAASTHVLLRATDRPSRHVDLSLRLDPIEPATLVRSVHGYPAVSPGRLRAAARESGGLPGRFLAHLRNRPVHAVEYLRVAEAHPAYDAGESPGEPELGHPWKELIASAVRLAVQGRTAAADRDLKQISAAADR